MSQWLAFCSQKEVRSTGESSLDSERLLKFYAGAYPRSRAHDVVPS